MLPFTDLFMSPLTVLLDSPSDALRKMVSPQMIGVEPLQAGICSFHVTFSSTVHLTGRFFSLLTPLSAGPRHCGQLSAETMFSAATVDRAMMTNTSVNRRRMSFLRKSLYPGAMFIFSRRRSLLLNDSSNGRSISGDIL